VVEMRTYADEIITSPILTDKLSLSQEENKPKVMNFDIIRKKRREKELSQVE
jgi:hypothetical protein